MPTTGQKLKAMRMMREFGIKACASRCMVGYRQYIDYENSKYLIHEPMIYELAQFLRCNPEDLMGDDWIPEAERTKENLRARREKLFGVSVVRDLKKTVVNGKDVTDLMEQAGEKMQQAANELEKCAKELDEKDKEIEELKKQINYLNGIVEDATRANKELNAKVQDFEETAKLTTKEVAAMQRENKRLKDALAKIMLKQIEQED